MSYLSSASGTCILGFFSDCLWHLYDGAYLIDSGADIPANAGFWDQPDFKRGYCLTMNGLVAGMQLMFYAMRILCNPNINGMDVRLAPLSIHSRHP
jgi:hypothetical protein